MSRPLEMDPGIRERWVAALRSGKYAQGSGRLKSGDGYCCLGILCELAVEDKVISPAHKGTYSWVYDGQDNFPPETVRQWAGLSANDPVVTDAATGATYSLSRFNDGFDPDVDESDEEAIDSRSFEQIADLIETGG